MPDLWQLRLKGTDGSLDAYISDYAGFSFSRWVNLSGCYALRFAQRSDQTREQFQALCALFVLDAQIEFWRANPEIGIDWRLEFEGFHRWPHWYVRADGALVYESGGRGYVDLLNRRIVAAKSTTAEAKKTGPAETVLKAFVDEQCGPGAGARAISGLAIEADGGGGNSVYVSQPGGNMLELARDIARVGGGDFDVIGTGPGTVEFRWYDGQRGTDRSAAVIFALERGNMAEPHLRYARQDEVNAVWVAGQGEKLERETLWRETPGLIADSPWNRMEKFRDARHIPLGDTAGLEMAGDIALDEGRPRWQLGFTALQTPKCMYGLHYFLGDLVTARFLDYEGVRKITGITCTVNSEGEGTLISEIEVEATDV